MKIIIGLGNPGKKYEFTRHNAGYLVINEIAEERNIKVTEKQFLSYTGKIKIGREFVYLIKPLTYMNLSGKAIAAAKKGLKVKMENLLVIYDDADLDLGVIKFRGDGTAGGHNGLQSIIEELQTNKFSRLRIGIGRSGRRESLEDFVLKPMDRKTALDIKESIDLAAEAALFWASEGISAAMNKFNIRK